MNTEKNEYKNYNVESLRILNKYDNDFKYKKLDNKRNYNYDKINDKKILLNNCQINKENKINNLIDISKNNIDKFGEDIFNIENKNKNKGTIKNNNKKLHFFGLLTFNDKIIQNNI